MEIIGKIINNNQQPVCKMFISTAQQRKDYFREHKHTDFEISLILKGQGIYNTSSGICDISVGDVFVYSTNEKHCITDVFVTQEAPYMQLLNLHFSPSFVWNIGNDYLKNSYLEIFFNRPKNFHNRLNRNNPALTKITQIIFEIRKEFEQANIDFQSAVKIKLLELLIYIHREFFPSEKHISAEFQTKHLKQIEKSINFINKNFCEELSLEELAKQAFMSRTYFCTIFKQLNGMSPWQYINIKRIDKAIELLKNTNLNILEIAASCGYNNTANFNKIFKSITNTTPKEYRKKLISTNNPIFS